VLSVNNPDYELDTTRNDKYILTIMDNGNKKTETYPRYGIPETGSVGGSSQTFITILGRRRKITKVGHKNMITFKGHQISVAEARAIEKQQNKKRNDKK
jgi:hypothetical protein